MEMSAKLDEVLSTSSREALETFIERVCDRHGKHIIAATLFGSSARGQRHAGSDLDVLLIVDSDDWRLKHSISSVAADVGVELDVLIDARVIGVERWRRMERERFGLYQAITRDGVPISLAPAA
jgi:uncharacterized protein